MNPRGRFDLTLFNEAARYGDRDYEEAIKRGELDALLLDVGAQQEVSTDNLLFDSWLTFLFYRSGWSGCPTPPTPYQYWESQGAGMMSLYLTYYDNGYEPGYQDDGDPGYYNTRDNMSYNCGSGCGRYFDEHVSQDIFCDVTGREQIFIRKRFFFYPTEITGSQNNLRGVWIVWCEDVGDCYANDKRWMGRVRFKDKNGDFVRVHKTNYQCMTLDYTFSFVTI